MTQHETLAVLDAAQRTHLKPESEGGHGGPLMLNCLMQAVALNAREIGYPAGFLRQQITRALPILVRKGWVTSEDKCGQQMLVLTQVGIGQLEAWNRNGCESHARGGRSADTYNRRCVGKVLTDRARRAEKGRAA